MTAKPLKISTRSDVPPFRVMDVMNAAAALEAQGRRIIHMEVGEPGLPTPRAALEAGERAMRAGQTGYTLALGLPALRQRIAAHYGEHYSQSVDPERVIITTGSSTGFSLAFLACFDIGDRVALGRPGYPAYGRIMRALGVETVEIATHPEDGFQPTPDQIDALADVDGLLLASPSNPTSTMIGPDALAAVAQTCKDRGIRLISDEIYHRMVFDGDERTALEFDDQAIVINSFSKYYCMTGWRIGWMVVPDNLVRPVERLSQNLFISPPTVAQHIALACFDCSDELDQRVDRYRANRDLLVRELAGTGLDFAPAKGAFYLYADISKFSNDSSAFCKDMLEGAGVATVPGIDFDEDLGRSYIRMCFAGTSEDMAEAAHRLNAWLATQA
ncbi:MAG: pyridoxal phosphate-dependent aminotransferase [Alphaproteobacteria bacterium]